MKYMLDTDTLICFLLQKPPSVSSRLNALAEGATLVTSNVGEFTRIRGLAVENWAVT